MAIRDRPVDIRPIYANNRRHETATVIVVGVRRGEREAFAALRHPEEVALLRRDDAIAVEVDRPGARLDAHIGPRPLHRLEHRTRGDDSRKPVFENRADALYCALLLEA